MFAGAISEIYIGDNIDAMPMPTPPIKRKKINVLMPEGIMMPIEEMANAKAEIINTFFLPSLSLKPPESMALAIQPTSAHEAAQPFMAGERLNFSSINPMAPATTAVSYPNNKPPSAATIVYRYTYFKLSFCIH